jgi:hypothetical protein
MPIPTPNGTIRDTLTMLLKSLTEVKSVLPEFADEASSLEVNIKSLAEMIIFDIEVAEKDGKEINENTPSVIESEQIVEDYSTFMSKATNELYRRSGMFRDD